MLTDSIQKTIVLSLTEDRQRRQHIRKHFSEIGISYFEFFEAVEASNDKVKDVYRKRLVKAFPECFRCHKDDCQCNNNILIPQQVANWLSFIEIWKSLKGKKGLFLICEDDVVFHKNAIPLVNDVIAKVEDTNQRVLIRLVASGQQPNKVLDLSQRLEIVDEAAMSNAAYILSGAMAEYLLEEFKRIEHTSDVWLHKEIASHENVIAMTVKPLIGTDLSFNKKYAQFLSQIHPKGLDDADTKRAEQHIKRVNSSEEYQDLLVKWLSS